jgi:hypothetical protein
MYLSIYNLSIDLKYGLGMLMSNLDIWPLASAKHLFLLLLCVKHSDMYFDTIYGLCIQMWNIDPIQVQQYYETLVTLEGGHAGRCRVKEGN